MEIDESESVNVALQERIVEGTVGGGKLDAVTSRVSDSESWQLIRADQRRAVFGGVLLRVGFDDTQELALFVDLNIWRLPLNDHVLWIWDHTWWSGWLVTNSLGLLTIWQPTLNVDLLWLWWDRWQALDDHLTGWWWHDLAWHMDQFAWDWDWWWWWSLTKNDRWWGGWLWWGLTHDQGWSWRHLSVWQLLDDDVASFWWWWWLQVSLKQNKHTHTHMHKNNEYKKDTW